MLLGHLLNALTKCLVLPGPFFSGSGWTHLGLQDGHVWDCHLAHKVGDSKNAFRHVVKWYSTTLISIICSRVYPHVVRGQDGPICVLQHAHDVGGCPEMPKHII